MKQFGLVKAQRIRRSAEYAVIYELAQRAGDNVLLVFGAATDRPQTRFGLSVSRRHGNAVRRNVLKRLLREAFRLSQHDLPAGMDLILIPRRDLSASLPEVQQSLVRLAWKLARRLKREVPK